MIASGEQGYRESMPITFSGVIPPPPVRSSFSTGVQGFLRRGIRSGNSIR